MFYSVCSALFFTSMLVLHCKNYPYKHGILFLWRVLHILTEPVPYTFVSVNQIGNNEAQAGPNFNVPVLHRGVARNFIGGINLI